MRKTALLSLVLSTLIFVLSLSNLYSYTTKQKITSPKVLSEVTGPNTTLQDQKNFWENFVSKNPTYQDGWINLAQINYELKNKIDYDVAIKKSEEINPLSPKLQELKIKTSGF